MFPSLGGPGRGACGWNAGNPLTRGSAGSEHPSAAFASPQNLRQEREVDLCCCSSWYRMMGLGISAKRCWGSLPAALTPVPRGYPLLPHGLSTPTWGWEGCVWTPEVLPRRRLLPNHSCAWRDGRSLQAERSHAASGGEALGVKSSSGWAWGQRGAGQPHHPHTLLVRYQNLRQPVPPGMGAATPGTLGLNVAGGHQRGGRLFTPPQVS